MEPVTESNCYVIREEDKCMIIDPNDFTAIRELLQKLGLMPGLVLLTHEHCDHIGGLNELRRTYPVTVAATEACSAGIGNQTKNMSRMMETFLYFKSRGKRNLYIIRRFSAEGGSDIYGPDLLQICNQGSWS